MRKYLFVACLAGAAFVTPAAAKEPTIVVPVVQAELQSEAGVAALYEKLETAAKIVCRRASVVPSGYVPERAKCRAATLKKAVEASGLAPLGEYYASLHGVAPTEVAAR